MKTPSLFITLCYLTVTVNAQMSFHDSKGETSILSTGVALGINTSKDAVRLGFIDKVASRNWSWGLEIEATPKNGLATLISSKDNDILLSGDVEFILNYELSQNGGNAWDLSLAGKLSGIKFKLVNMESTDIEMNVRDVRFNGFQIGPNLYHFANGNTLFGIGLRFGETNTFTDLKKRKIETFTVSIDSLITRKIIEDEQGYQGEYVEQFETTVLTDLAYLPSYFNDRLFVNVYSRFRITEEIANTIDLGIGFYVNKASGSTKIIGGLYYEIRDLFNNRGREPDLLDRGKLGLSVGYNF